MATELLKKAFAEVGEKLPEFEQDALAEWLLELIAMDSGWDQVFSDPKKKHDDLADGALDAYRRGDVEDLDPDKL